MEKMRIIAGERRGVVLKTCDFEGFRPTLDRVKESLFGTLSPHLEGARVLDLFAGSGALALEALSHGAASALMIDNDPRAVKVIEHNIAKCAYQDRARIVCADWRPAAKLVAKETRFDLIFADPPYLRGFPELVLSGVAEHEWLAEDGLLILEMATKEARGLNHSGFEILREKKYGSTVVWIMRRVS